MPPTNNESGAALITALFIMTLVAIAATLISTRLQLNIQRSAFTFNADKLYFFGQGVEYWAIGLLKQAVTQKNSAIERIDQLPQKFSTTRDNGMLINGTLDDQQGLFNINNLADIANLPQFILLLKIVIPTIEDSQAKTIALTINQRMKPLAANKPAIFMTSISELRLIPGISSLIFLKLAPYLTALPEPTTNNINTAPLPILMSLGAGITVNQAKTIIHVRKNLNGFSSIEQFINYPDFKDFNIPSKQITVSSKYFLAHSKTTLGDQYLVLNTLLQRDIIENKPLVQVLWQIRGMM